LTGLGLALGFQALSVPGIIAGHNGIQIEFAGNRHIPLVAIPRAGTKVVVIEFKTIDVGAALADLCACLTHTVGAEIPVGTRIQVIT
jgi:hypothetical protein